MAPPTPVPSQCPTCGASLPVPPGAQQVTCRYCQAVINVERKKPPPEHLPFGTPGALPSRTLYLDPAAGEAATKAAKGLGCIIAGSVLLPIVIVVGVGVGPWAFRSCKSAIKPFPVACDTNEEITVSGNYEGPGPLVTSVGSNCKLHIKDSKLKGSTLMVASSAYNVELTLENVTLETTETAVHSGTSLKVNLTNSTVTSGAGPAFDVDMNFDMTASGSTIESKQAAAVKTKSNLKARLENTKLRGKKAAFDTDANFTLSMKKGSELAAADGPAVKTTSSFKLDAEGGKIDGGLVLTSSGDIQATGLTVTAKEPAIAASSSSKLDLTDSAITSSADTGIVVESSSTVILANTKVEGATNGINADGSTKIRATKKTRIVGLQGTGIVSTSNVELNVADAAVEGRLKAFKGDVNEKLRLGQGASLMGKKGGIEVEGNLDLDATGAVLDGGAGPGILGTYGAKISFKQGALKGTPALQLQNRPRTLELDGTRVDGEQKFQTR